MRIGLRLALAALLACASGCIEEKDTVTVYPDGSGKLEVSMKLGEQMSKPFIRRSWRPTIS
jgi:hypothetical protein